MREPRSSVAANGLRSRQKQLRRDGRGTKLMLDRNVNVPIPCPKCEKEVKETIARLETNPTLTCPACGTAFKVESEELVRGLKELEQQITKLKGKTVINIKL